MPRRRSVLNPKLRAVVEALARMVVAQQLREEAEAAPQIVRLRQALGLDHDAAAEWKRRVEGLMRAYYRLAPDALTITLAQRLDGLLLAVADLGPRAADRRLVLRAVELTSWPAPAPPPRRRRRASAAQDIVTPRS